MPAGAPRPPHHQLIPYILVHMSMARKSVLLGPWSKFVLNFHSTTSQVCCQNVIIPGLKRKGHPTTLNARLYALCVCVCALAMCKTMIISLSKFLVFETFGAILFVAQTFAGGLSSRLVIRKVISTLHNCGARVSTFAEACRPTTRQGPHHQRGNQGRVLNGMLFLWAEVRSTLAKHLNYLPAREHRNLLNREMTAGVSKLLLSMRGDFGEVRPVTSPRNALRFQNHETPI